MTTRNPQEAKARQIIIEEHYKLVFLPDPDPRKWPQQHVVPFEYIQKLGATRFDEWKEDIDVNWRDYPWKLDTKDQVGCVVQKARECSKEESNEFEWRMALEPLLFKRFNHGVSW